MRISEEDKQAIVSEFKKSFGSDDRLWLFGSRVDDAKKGGDIDLYVQTHLPGEVASRQEGKFRDGMYDQIGEQRIDVVLHLVDTDFHIPIYDIAKQEGIRLV